VGFSAGLGPVVSRACTGAIVPMPATARAASRVRLRRRGLLAGAGLLFAGFPLFATGLLPACFLLFTDFAIVASPLVRMLPA